MPILIRWKCELNFRYRILYAGFVFLQVGVDHLILAVAYQSAAMLLALEDLEKKVSLRRCY